MSGREGVSAVKSQREEQEPMVMSRAPSDKELYLSPVSIRERVSSDTVLAVR